MIGKFFKENAHWYLLYLVVTGLFLLTFALYRLPLAYFSMALLFATTILVFASFLFYYSFRKQMLALEDIRELSELKEFTKPLNLAYLAALENQKAISSQQLLEVSQENEELRQIVRLWSHQMKVPLAALSLMTQTDSLNQDDASQQLLRMENYLQTLLSYLKFSQHQDDYRFEQVSVAELIRALVKKYRVFCIQKDLSVTVTGDWQVLSDKKWLNFALSQVLDNAIKYSHKGGQILIRLSERGMTISDTGMGILPEDLPRLFEAGFTGYNGHEHQKASGFGLYMTKQVLDQLNLSIQIDSQVEEGTTVAIFKESR